MWERLPHALIAANLGQAGITALAAPLISVEMEVCAIFPSPGWAAGLVWASAVAGAVVGVGLLFLFHLWTVRRGLAAWRVVAAGEGAVRPGRWRALWWWVPLSFLALAGGLVVSIVLQQVWA